MSATLAGRGAFVTGGGGGIGAAAGRALAAAGARVAVAGRDLDALGRVVDALHAAGAEAIALACDVTDEASVAEAADAARVRLGGVDILVNNAGAAAAAPLAKITIADWNRVLAVNATGTFLCTRAFLPPMLAAGHGRVVNVGSMAGLIGGRYVAHYTAAKHAVIGLTRAAAAEVAGTGVTVNAVCPGYVDTPMTARTVANVQARTGRSPADALAAVLASAGQRRLVSPDEVAHAIVGLCMGEDNGRSVVLAGGGHPDVGFEIVNPPALGEPRGWSNGVLAPAGGRTLFVAGQAGWASGGAGPPPDFTGQFARALDQVLEVVRAAGGQPHDIARLTIYVTDVNAYRAALRALGAVWRERLGAYYPALALVEVNGLVDHGALVEIEATAVLGGAR